MSSLLSFFLLLVIVLICLSSITSFNNNKYVGLRRISNLNMMFGGSKSSGKGIVINVDGKKIECSGAVNLRKELIANKIDVYPLKAKITGNCGGAGICGTCAVKVIDGAKNLNPPSKNELNTLRGKPADQRLSCCARVNGPITIKTKP
jgi:ferredoxin